MASASAAAAELDELESKIENVERDIELVKAALGRGGEYLCSKDQAWIRSELAQLREKERLLREEKRQLHEKELLLLRRRPPPTSSARDLERFLLQARVGGCLRLKGIRRLIFRDAEQHQAFCASDDQKEAVGYDGEDLCLNLAFETRTRALAYASFLRNLNEEATVRGRVTVGSVTRDMEAFGVAVERTHYVVQVSGSPEERLEDVSSHATVASPIIQVEVPLIKYRCLESSQGFVVSGFNRCHIKDVSVCKLSDERGVKDPNNMLAMSPSLHFAFNGSVSVPPSFGLSVHEVASQPTATECGVRYRVQLEVRCRALEMAPILWQCFKSGTEKVEETVLRTWVYVGKPNDFQTYIEW